MEAQEDQHKQARPELADHVKTWKNILSLEANKDYNSPYPL